MADIEVSDNPGAQRFEIRADGELAGFAEYRDHPSSRPGRMRRTFTHTETEPAYEGQGLASQLIRAALDSTRERGFEVIPVCPFVRSYLSRHPEYVDLVPPDVRARFELS